MRRFLLITILVFATVTISATPTAPVSHSHNGRTHNHSLPVQGLNHRHGGSAVGVRAGTISSTVEYQSPRVVVKKKNSNTKIVALQNRRDLSKGDIYCGKDQTNCNVCANNVRQQFNQASTRRINWSVQSWQFAWPKKYPPVGKRPLDIFRSNKVFGIPSKHIQGFARTNSARFPYVGSHSHKRKGGVFVVSQNAKGQKILASLHPTKTNHPTGVQVIGDYLIYYDYDTLVFRDLSSPNHSRQGSIKIKQKDKYSAGGGLGILRQVNNKLLLVTSGPGGQRTRPRYNYFYTIETKNYLPNKIHFLNKSRIIKPAQWPAGLAYSENLSVVTECGTGDIYSIHTSGDGGINSLTGNNYWRLSKLNQRNGKLSLSPINAFMTPQNLSNCHGRSAATVSVNKQHQLVFSCHAFAKNPNGTLFDISRPTRNGADKFYFKTGTIR